MIDTTSDYKEKYLQLFNQSPFHISLFDLNGNLVESNSIIITKLAEFAKLDFKGKNFIEIANYFENSKQIIKMLMNRFKDIREGKILEPVDFFLLTKENKKIWLRWSSTIIELKDQKLIQVIIQDITEQKNAEEKLKESEGNYRLITENANDLIRVLNDRFEIEFANEKAHYRVLGYSQEDLLGKTAIFLNHPEDYTSIRRYMRKVFKNGEGTHESRLRHKNGNWIWFEIKFKVFTDEKGDTKYLNLSRDITERKKAEYLLKDRAQKLEFLNEIIIKGNRFIDINTLMNDILELSTKMMGFDGGGIYLINDKTNNANLKCHIGLPLSFVEFAQTIPTDKNPYRQIFIDNKPLFSENYPDINPDVFERWGFLSVASIPLYSKKKVLGAMNITSKKNYFFTDEEKDILQSIGRQIGTAIEKIQAEQKLKESEGKFRRIFESIPDLFFLVSGDGTILDYKGNVEELYFPAEIFLGKNIIESLTKHIIDLSLTSIKKTLENHEPQVAEFDLKISGKIRYFKARHLYFSKDEVLVFIRDISKRKQAIQDIKESEEKFRNIAEQTFMGILIVQDGKVKYTNKAIFQISGYTPEEVLKWKQEDILQMIHPEDLNALFERLQKNIKGTMSPLSRNTFRIINKDGKVRWLEDYSSKIIYQGKPANLLSIIDITDKKEAEQLIVEENKRLLELQDLRKDIITRVPH